MSDAFNDVATKPLTVGEPPDTVYTDFAAIAIGMGSQVFHADQDGMWLGAAKFDDAPFKVDMAGNATATSITVSGYIAVGGAASYVNAGVTEISGGKIVAGSLTVTNAEIVSVAAGKITSQIVDAQIANIEWAKIDNVVVQNADIQSITADKVSSGTFDGINMTIGTGNSVFKADSNGIYLGNATFGLAPFRVSMAGALTATSATITGDIQSGSTITGATITGGTVRTSNTGTRVQLNGSQNQLEAYNGGTLRMLLYADAVGAVLLADTGILNLNAQTHVSVNPGTGSFNVNADMDMNSNAISGVTTLTASSWASIGGDLDMNSNDVNEIQKLQFGSSGNSTTSGTIWFYDAGGGTYYWRSRNGSWNGQFDQSAF